MIYPFINLSTGFQIVTFWACVSAAVVANDQLLRGSPCIAGHRCGTLYPQLNAGRCVESILEKQRFQPCFILMVALEQRNYLDTMVVHGANPHTIARIHCQQHDVHVGSSGLVSYCLLLESQFILNDHSPWQSFAGQMMLNEGGLLVDNHGSFTLINHGSIMASDVRDGWLMDS